MANWGTDASQWPNPALLIFHRAFGSSGDLYYKTSSPPGLSINDAPHNKTPTVRMSCDPSAVQFGNKLYVFHQDVGLRGELWYAVMDRTRQYDSELGYWEADRKVPGTGMSAGPGAVVYQGKIWVFHQGGGENGELWGNVFDGVQWRGDVRVGNVKMASGPSAVVYREKLYVFHQGGGSDGSLWYSVFDGQTWAPDTQVSSTRMSAGPSAVVWKGAIYVFHKGDGVGGELRYNVFHGKGWGGDVKVKDARVNCGPSAVVFGNNLHVFYRQPGWLGNEPEDADEGNGGWLMFNVLSTSGWAENVPVERMSIGVVNSPAAVVFTG